LFLTQNENQLEGVYQISLGDFFFGCFTN